MCEWIAILIEYYPSKETLNGQGYLGSWFRKYIMHQESFVLLWNAPKTTCTAVLIAVQCIWVRDFAKGILMFCVSSCCLCTFSKVPHPFTLLLSRAMHQTLHFSSALHRRNHACIWEVLLTLTHAFIFTGDRFIPPWQDICSFCMPHLQLSYTLFGTFSRERDLVSKPPPPSKKKRKKKSVRFSQQKRLNMHMGWETQHLRVLLYNLLTHFCFE